jgi:hypothetical protein
MLASALTMGAEIFAGAGRARGGFVAGIEGLVAHAG